MHINKRIGRRAGCAQKDAAQSADVRRIENSHDGRASDRYQIAAKKKEEEQREKESKEDRDLCIT